MRQPYRVITRRRTRHLQKSRGPFQDPCNALVSHRVFCSVNGTSPDDFPRRFGLEHHRLFGEPYRLSLAGGRLQGSFELTNVSDADEMVRAINAMKVLLKSTSEIKEPG